MIIRSILLAAGVLGIVSGILPVAQAQVSVRPVQIGFVLDGPWERNEEILALKQRELMGLLQGEFEVTFPAGATIVADYSLTGIESALDSLFRYPDLDVIIAAGPSASHLAARRDRLPVPVIAPYIIDVSVQGIPFDQGTSGVPNLCYLAAPWNTERELRAFHEIVPFRKLALLSSPQITEAIPELGGRLLEAVADFEFEVQVVPTDHDVEAALANLDPDVDAVYLTSLMHLTGRELDRLIEAINERGLPSFAMLGREHVERGALAGLMDPAYLDRSARRIALNVQRILLGEDAGDLPVAFTKEDHLVINDETRRRVGVSPNWSVLTEAELINQKRIRDSRQVSLTSVMQEAPRVNRDLLSRQEAVRAGEEFVKQAWSVLLPQLDLSATGLRIDRSRAEAGQGLYSERTLTGSIGGSQVVISEPAWANVSIQRNLQASLEAEYEELRLDVAQSAATAFLNTLRASTNETIQRENLKVTQSNLDMARVREALGTARAAEVLRWESQLAANRTQVIDANALRNLAEIELNRVLDRPLEEAFTPTPVTVTQSDLLTANGTLFEYMRDPQSFRTLRTFMTTEALNQSPELVRIDRAIRAQERLVKSTGWSFIVPQLALFGDVTRTLAEGGIGSDITLPGENKTQWNLGFEATLPLFEGGARVFERKQAQRDLSSLQEQRISVAQRVEQRVRSALHLAGASYAGIKLAQDAARAAVESFELVTDAYSRGSASILDLIDAQNAALVASLAAANAEYDFVIDLLEVERATGRFVVFMTTAERTEFFDRLADYFRTHPD